MNRNQLDDLLNDVLVDPPDRDLLRRRARSRFKWAVRRKRFAKGLAVGALVMAFLSGVMISSRQSAKPAARPIAIVHSKMSAKTPASLTDEELLRFFPPGSCCLAEVNGKVVLVFKDEALKKQFLN